LSGNLNIIKKNTEAVLDATEEVGLEINVEETKYMFVPCHQTTGQNPLKMWKNSNIWE
jgi:hypothetical protein